MGYLDHISNTIFTIEFENMNSLEQKAEVIRKPCEGLYTKRYRSHDFYVRSMDKYNYEINSNDKSTAIVNLLMCQTAQRRPLRINSIGVLLRRCLMTALISSCPKLTAQRVQPPPK